MYKNMSTFSLLLMLLFLIVFGVQFFMYFVNMEMPRFSRFLTLLLILMLIAEIIISSFELPAKLIDLIVLISMGNKTIVICCAAVIFTVLLFILVKLLPKFKWKKILKFTPVKYVIMGFLVIVLAIYTELFNGCYSFDSLNEYNDFKQNFAKYDRRFWPTKYIKSIEDNGQEKVTTYSIYPWDVEITDGRQFAYKVVTFYGVDSYGDSRYFYYYPFTYNLYAGVSSTPVEYEKSEGTASPAVSQSDTGGDSKANGSADDNDDSES